VTPKSRYRLDGIVPIINTPFDNNLGVDFASLERLLDASIADGIVGCIGPAVASEVGKLTPQERRQLVRAVAEFGRGRIEVIAGVSSEDLGEARQLATEAVAAGCHGVLCRVPERLRGDDAGIVAFFISLADTGVDMLMIQDLDWTGYGMNLELILRMFEGIPAFRCVKIETVPAGAKYTQVLQATGGALHISAGWALPQMIEALDRGVHAFNTTAINRPFVRIYDLHTAGRRSEAQRLFDRILPYLAWSHQHIDVSIQFLKRYCVRRGLFSTARVRPPILAYDDYHERCGAELIEQVIAIENALSPAGARAS